MNRNDKKAKRDYISTHIDTSKARLKDDEVDFLCEFIDGYDEKYKGRTHTHRSSYDGWSSDGKYTRKEETTYIFSDDIGIDVYKRQGKSCHLRTDCSFDRQREKCKAGR